MNLGLPELVIIFVVALLVFGPKRLPELAKGLGKGIRDFKKALNGEEENLKEIQPDTNKEHAHQSSDDTKKS